MNKQCNVVVKRLMAPVTAAIFTVSPAFSAHGTEEILLGVK